MEQSWYPPIVDDTAPTSDLPWTSSRLLLGRVPHSVREILDLLTCSLQESGAIENLADGMGPLVEAQCVRLNLDRLVSTSGAGTVFDHNSQDGKNAVIRPIGGLRAFPHSCTVLLGCGLENRP